MNLLSFEEGSSCYTDLEASAFELWLWIAAYTMEYKVTLPTEQILPLSLFSQVQTEFYNIHLEGLWCMYSVPNTVVSSRNCSVH